MDSLPPDTTGRAGGRRSPAREKGKDQVLRRFGVLLIGLLCLGVAGGVMAAHIATAQSTVLYKNPSSANLFIGGEPVVINEEVAGIPGDRGLGEFEFVIIFDPDLVEISIAEGPFLGSMGRTTSCQETRLSATEIAFACQSSGTQRGPTGSGILASITVTPSSGLVLRPTIDNGVVALLDDRAAGARLVDTSGAPIVPEQVLDAVVIVQALEADLNQDCTVNVIDEQLESVRYPATLGSPLYDPFFDLAPQWTDADIDIKDLQFVYGRDGLVCPTPVPLPSPTPSPTPTVTPLDSDGDGCTDEGELGANPVMGGSRDSLNPYDFYDVPVPTAFDGGTRDDRDRAISVINDVLAVLEYSGCSDGGPPNAAGRQYNQDNNGDDEDDGILYDRSVGVVWSDAPDGAITIIVDVLLVLAQSGHSCQAPP